MATFAVTTNSNYNDFSPSAHDRFTISQGARLTINTSTDQIERLLCNTLGEAYVENTSNTTPIVVKTGENGATANGQIRFEAGGKLITRGEWIELGAVTGFPSQSFTLPLTDLSSNIPFIPTIFVFPSGGGDPIIFNKTDSFVDAFGDEKFGTLFTHVGNTIVLGDGTNGYIPNNGDIVKIANIFFFEEGTGTGYMDFDLATSGTLDFDKCYWSEEHAFNFSSASKVTVKNSGFDHGRELFNCGSQQGLLFENVGAIVNISVTGGIQGSALNNFTFRNVFIYNILAATNYHGLYMTNGANGIIEDCRVVAPEQPYSTSRAAFYMTSPNLTFNNCFAATAGVGWNFGAGSGQSTVTDCGKNGQGKRNSAANGSYMALGANSADNVFTRYNSYPLLASEGAKSSNVYCFAASTGTANWTFNDCDLYVGEVGDASRSNNPIFSNGVGHRFNKIRIHGDFSGDLVNHSTASSGTEVRNVSFENAETNTNDIEWTDGVIYDLIASPDALDTAPSAAGIGVGSLHLIESNDPASGRIYKPFGDPADTGLFDSSGITGNYFFDNAGKFYMDTANDIAVFESSVHGGILSFRGTNKSGSTSTNFDVKIAMRQAGGTYTAFVDDTANALNAALATITNYDSDLGLQFKWQITRTASNLTNYLFNVRINTTLDTLYESPFILSPVEMEFSNIISGSRLLVKATSSVGDITTGDVLVNEIVTTDPFIKSFEYSGDMSFSYTIRKGTTTPYYKSVVSSGILKSGGSSIVINQIPDS